MKNTLIEKKSIQRSIKEFFGMEAAYVKGQKMTLADIDEAIKANLRL